MFDHMHAKSVIFRDLKPENVVLDQRGWPKLVDFGIAKKITGATYTTCGTPDYFAPEVIQQSGMTKAVDWWTLGCFIHELMTAKTPFAGGNDPAHMYAKIVKGMKPGQKFAFKSEEARSLIRSLLVAKAHQRLPMKKGGIKNVENHEFFKGISWTKLEMRDKSVELPHVPKDVGETHKNFTASEIDAPPTHPFEDDGSGWDGEW